MTPSKFIIAHDIGTSADKAILVTVTGDIIGSCKSSYPLYYPQPAFAEHNPEELWQAICNNTRELLRITSVSPAEVVGITFSSLMQCLIAIDKEGKPLTPNITWLDGRSAEIIREVLWTAPRVQGYNIFKLLRFLRITGGAPGHTGKEQIGKLLWLQRYQPEVFWKAHKFLDAKDFIIFKMTDQCITSVDLAVVWWLLDTRQHRNQWDPGLCQLAGITPDKLSEVKESAVVVGHLTSSAAAAMGLAPGTAIINGAGDLSAAALGSGAINEGELHIALGTSDWVAGHFSKRKIDLAHYTGCIGSSYPQKYYLAMAHQETGAVCLDWFKNLVFSKGSVSQGEAAEAGKYLELNDWAEQSPVGAKGLFFLPWMYGERCPINDDLARAGFFNLSLHHGPSEMVRAIFEGVAFNLRWALDTLQDLYQPVEVLSMIGGGARSELWCQIIADITGKKIRQVENPQLAGAKGIALLASMTLGYLEKFEQIKDFIRIKKIFTPRLENFTRYNEMFKEFKNLYFQNKKWFRRVNRIFS